MPIRTYQIEGMLCQGCETVIEQALKKLPGIAEAKADYTAGNVRIVFDPGLVDFPAICSTIQGEGYRCLAAPREPSKLRGLVRGLGVLAALASIGWLLVAGSDLAAGLRMPELERDMSLGLLFLVGLLTGFHCVGMCGGFVLGYTARAGGSRRTALPHLIYGIGKTLSYTFFGGLFGLLGSFVAFTPEIRAYAAIGAGLFLVVFGINMLDWFPWLHRFSFKMPKSWSRFLGRESRKTHGPFVIGLLNGLMIACGPLQAMYVMAAGTGNFLEGAQLLLVFGIGTLPVMLGFGLLAGLVSGRLTHGILKASAVLVIALGLIMLNRGLTLSGSGYDFRNLGVRAGLLAERLKTEAADWEPLRQAAGRWDAVRVLVEGWTATEASAPAAGLRQQTIRMAMDAKGYRPNRFVLRQGVPVRWVIQADEITQCNSHIVVPAFGIEVELHAGKNLIEFTPEKAGVVPFSCWMGMLQGTFVVEAGTE